jgi:hypothetical protein
VCPPSRPVRLLGSVVSSGLLWPSPPNSRYRQLCSAALLTGLRLRLRRASVPPLCCCCQSRDSCPSVSARVSTHPPAVAQHQPSAHAQRCDFTTLPSTRPWIRDDRCLRPPAHYVSGTCYSVSLFALLGADAGCVALGCQLPGDRPAARMRGPHLRQQTSVY